ncbi:MAG: magnesium-translocating P-type ATPase [Bacteroidota bacterium]
MEVPQSPDKCFWHFPIGDAYQQFSSGENGLSIIDAAKNLRKYGPNLIAAKVNNSAVFLFLSQFRSPITILLMVAAVLSAVLGDVADTVIIFLIVLISSILGFWQEKGAAEAVRALLKMVQLHCNVLRDSKNTELALPAVVPGDVVLLSAGDIIPGDCLLITSQNLFVDEAAFTGESFPVEKIPGVLPLETPLGKRSNCLFMGAHVISGRATALVIQTGKQTAFGEISANLQLRPPETDFEKGIRKFGYLLMQITLLLVFVIFAINALLHKPLLDSFLFSLALAVGLTPQLLPAIISVNLASGARRMARQRVIVKRLSSIENFGSMNILCSDKTGTITEGKVKLKEALAIDGLASDRVLQYAWLNATKQQGFHNPVDEAISSGFTLASDTFNLLSEIPYDFIRKRLTVVVKNDLMNLAITKGALKCILSVCTKVETKEGEIADLAGYKKTILEQYKKQSEGGFRTLGIAYKSTGGKDNFTMADESDMTFLGFITLYDPPKANVGTIIAHLQELGVKLKIITGDNALVAKSLALQVGFQTPKILTGEMMQKMSSAALLHQAPLTDIFAEVEPNQKERIISILKKAGHVVGFMGDGINDAPALHTADVGISVDTAVDVAKQAADIVLLTPGLEVLIGGIIEGRKTFTNTMKYIFMATSANFGNMFSMAGASLFLPFLPLLPKQILLTNLLTDFPEMAIATDRVDAINTATPQRWNLASIKRFMITFGLLSSIFDFLTFGLLLFVFHAKERVFQTGWFTESVISATLIVLVVRTRLPFFNSLPGKFLSIATIFILLLVLALPISPFAAWFGFTRLSLPYYCWMLLIIGAYIFAAELTKRWFYKKAVNSIS